MIWTQTVNARRVETWRPLLAEPAEALPIYQPFRRAGRNSAGRAGGRRSPSCHLQRVKPRPPPPTPPLSSRKCVWNTLLTFPLLVSLFIAQRFRAWASWWWAAVPPSRAGWMFVSGSRNTAMMEILLPRFNLPEYRLGRVHPYGD